jgi:two-component system, LytTR family, response regulator
MRVAIVDDEPLARLRLRRLLQGRDDVSLVGEYGNGSEMISGLQHSPVDVVLLDITMPGFNGFQSLSNLRIPYPAVIFVTAHSRYAVDAFGINAVDYILKPVSADRLNVALDRARGLRVENGSSNLDNVSVYDLELPMGHAMEYVSSRDVYLVESDGNYIVVHVAGRKIAVRRSLSWIEERLAAKYFVRVHRSYIVRVDAVVKVKSLGSGRCQLSLSNGLECQTGRAYIKSVRRVFSSGAEFATQMDTG